MADRSGKPGREGTGTVDSQHPSFDPARPGSYKLESRRLPGSHVLIELQGEWDLYNRPELESALDAAVVSAEPTIVVDLSGSTFIDSAIVGAFVAAKHRIEEGGGSIEVVIVTNGSHVGKTLEITGLNRIFRTYERLEAVKT